MLIGQILPSSLINILNLFRPRRSTVLPSPSPLLFMPSTTLWSGLYTLQPTSSVVGRGNVHHALCSSTSSFSLLLCCPASCCLKFKPPSASYMMKKLLKHRYFSLYFFSLDPASVVPTLFFSLLLKHFKQELSVWIKYRQTQTVIHMCEGTHIHTYNFW